MSFQLESTIWLTNLYSDYFVLSAGDAGMDKTDMASQAWGKWLQTVMGVGNNLAQSQRKPFSREKEGVCAESKKQPE